MASGEVDLNIFYLASLEQRNSHEAFEVTRANQGVYQKGGTAPLRGKSRSSRVEVSLRSARHTACAVYHEPNFLPLTFAGPTVVSIHDLSWIRYPETHPKERVAIMNRLLPSGSGKVHHVITDSEFIRDEVISEFGFAADRVTSTLLAPRAMFTPRDRGRRVQQLLSKHNLQQRNYFLVRRNARAA